MSLIVGPPSAELDPYNNKVQTVLYEQDLNNYFANLNLSKNFLNNFLSTENKFKLHDFIITDQ